jgi:cyclophilin family peptidyl-prolyl cis-trans isomerase
MTWFSRAVLAVLAAALPAAPLAAQEEFFPLTSPVELAPGEPDKAVGALIFRGGVEIAPDKAGIGGISSLDWHDGKLYAVSDDGRWLVLTPEDLGARLVDVSAVRIGALHDRKGAKLGPKETADAEALTRLPTGEWLVAFERDHRIWRYADLAGPAIGTEERAAVLTAAADPNGGLETLAAFPGGLLACGEWADPARPNCLRITDAGAAPFTLAAPAGIAEFGGVPVDADCGADGTCFVLLRSFTPGMGNRAAIVALAPDNTASTLAVLAPPLALDNFEGLALREEPGRRFLYLASDDNFSNCETKPGAGCQRSLLMKFELRPPPAGPAPLTPADFAGTPTARAATRPHPEAASVSVVLETSLGPVTIALETARAPVTAANFLRYVDEKRLDGTTFYRAMDLVGPRQPSGLVQGGTSGDPKRVLPPIAHEPTGTTGLTHTHGAVAMAMGAPGSADGDFFIMIEDQTGFDADPKASDPAWRAGFAVFGYVTSGMEVVAAIHAAARDPQAGEGVMKGQILASPVTIRTARRVER